MFHPTNIFSQTNTLGLFHLNTMDPIIIKYHLCLLTIKYHLYLLTIKYHLYLLTIKYHLCLLTIKCHLFSLIWTFRCHLCLLVIRCRITGIFSRMIVSNRKYRISRVLLLSRTLGSTRIYIVNKVDRVCRVRM